MKILITGATGFIGRKLIVSAGKLYGLDNVYAMCSSTCLEYRTIIYNKKNFEISEPDISSLKEIDILIHAGAFIPKTSLDANNIERSNSNITFTTMLLALPFENLQKIVYLSSVDVYGESSLISESTHTLPSTLYGLSKLYCEKLVYVYAHSRKLKYQILRIGHVYGPGEEGYSKFLPNAIRNIVDNKPVELWGKGNELRSFIFIDDVVKAIINSAELSLESGIINIASSKAISILALLLELIKLSGKNVDIIRYEHSGIRRDLVFDNSKMIKYVLKNETELSTGLEEELDYFGNLK